jgi:CDP-glucose 4,6-dehydratase
LIALAYHRTYGLPLAITRCGNLYGGGDLNFNRLIPGTIRSALLEQAPLIRSDGKFIRDYVYVRDAVMAYLQLAEALPDHRFVGQAFNLGPEKPLSVLEVVQLILQLMGKSNLAPVVLNQACHEIHAQYLDCSKARTMLSWMPKYSIEAGLAETIAWYRGWLSEAES